MEGGGQIRYVGVTATTASSPNSWRMTARVDVLMHRFNMAHRKAASEVFPTATQAAAPVIAFTATRWGTLLESRPDWPGNPPTAADCYRFCLAQPAVQLVLTAPKSVDELAENLAVLELPPMNARDCKRWEQYGDLIYFQGQGKTHAFESRWP